MGGQKGKVSISMIYGRGATAQAGNENNKPLVT